MTVVTEVLAAEEARLRDAADRFREFGTLLPSYDPGPQVFGAVGPGRLAALAGRMHAHLSACLDARAREALAQGERLHGIADALRGVASGYGEVEDRAGRHRGWGV